MWQCTCTLIYYTILHMYSTLYTYMHGHVHGPVLSPLSADFAKCVYPNCLLICQQWSEPLYAGGHTVTCHGLHSVWCHSLIYSLVCHTQVFTELCWNCTKPVSQTSPSSFVSMGHGGLSYKIKVCSFSNQFIWFYVYLVSWESCCIN